MLLSDLLASRGHERWWQCRRWRRTAFSPTLSAAASWTCSTDSCSSSSETEGNSLEHSCQTNAQPLTTAHTRTLLVSAHTVLLSTLPLPSPTSTTAARHSTFDQYSNLVLAGCVERHIQPPHYADEPVGSTILRGENIVLMGALRTRDMAGLTESSLAEVRRLREEERGKGGDEELRLKEDDEFVIY